MRLLPLTLTLLLVAMPSLATAQQRYVPIEQRLSPEQLQSTGLDRLSAQQLQLLNGLLGDEQAMVEARAETSTRNRLADGPGRQPVEAAIKGEFRGWVPGRVIELENGQRWRVTEGELHVRKTVAHAKATVSPGLVGGWYLQVEGHSPRAKVQRLP